MGYTPEQAFEELLRRTEILDSFEKWCRTNGFEPARHHLLLIEKLEALCRGDINRLAIFMPPGSAKALALDTPIPTPDGWKRMGDLRVGDQVFDENGAPCGVTWVSPVWRDRPVYAVTTDCGDRIIADRDHEWLVRMCGKRDVFKLKETHQLHRKRAKRVMIRRAAALELPDVDLPVNPYLLGLWLGDGNSASPRITAHVDDQGFYRDELATIGVETRPTTVATLFQVIGLRGAMTSLNLLNDPHHSTRGRKHIPSIYLRASRQQRLDLLQGLIDTDGTVCRERGCTTFCNTNRELAEGVRELVRTLGVKAGWSVGRATLNGVDHGEVYRVSFYLRDAARLPRKARLARDQQRTPNTYIDVEPCGFADTVCIEVNSPSHLFLCGRSMLPTHNSTYASVLFPPWVMGNHPKAQFLAASHTSELAERWGRRVRNIVAEKGNLLGLTPDDDNQAAGRWATRQGGEYLAAGARIGIAGFRALFGVIDDPLRSREDAESETVRDRLWEWYLYDFRPRLIPGARQLVIQTRWHQDDLAGRLLNHQQWEVISLPAEALADDQLGRKPGEFLWDDGDYGYGQQLRELKATTPPRVWSALYQQAPAPEEGDFFKREWFRPLDIAPSHAMMRCYGASDYAVTSDGGDYCVHIVVGVDHLDNIYLLDVWRGQTTADVWIEAFCDLVDKYRPMAWAEETGQIKAALGPFVEQRMRQRRSWVNREQFPTRGDKATRARSIQGRLALDGIMYPKNAPWAAALFAELLVFPASKHDDQVDALGLVGQLLDVMVRGRTKAVTLVKEPVDGYKNVRRLRDNVDPVTL